MHRAAATFAVAVFFAEQFCDAAVDVIFKQKIAQLFVGFGGFFEGVLDLVVHDAGIHLHSVHVQDRGETLGHRIAVAAVRRGDVVIPIQHRAGPDRGGFLADRQMGWTLILVLSRKGLVGARPQLVDHFFESPHRTHLDVQRNRLGFVNRTGG